MKLILRIALHMTWLLSLLLAAWAVLFYFTIADEVNDEMDDSLENRAELVIGQRLAGRLSGTSGSGWQLREVSDMYAEGQPHVAYSDEKILIPGYDEREHARVLRTLFRDGEGRWCELTVMTPSVGKDDLRAAILYSVLCLYAALLVTVVLLNIVLLYRMLRPLYALLRWLDGYRVGGGNPPLKNDTKIVEFRRLNEAAQRYAGRAEALFERQKQFIGNASHEMQTPLAVCRNRLEMLVDDAPLSERQLNEIAKVQRSLDYLVRLNRSLLLLSKIDNGQFPEAGQVAFNALVRDTAEELAEIYAARGIRSEVRDEGVLSVRMNPSLAASMVTNLLKNAFVHNTEGGEVVVTVAPGVLEVCNSAAEGPLDAERVFERFYCQGARPEGSTGLGLSIVEAVCRLYGLSAAYRYADARHCFTVRFPEKK